MSSEAANLRRWCWFGSSEPACPCDMCRGAALLERLAGNQKLEIEWRSSDGAATEASSFVLPLTEQKTVSLSAPHGTIMVRIVQDD